MTACLTVGGLSRRWIVLLELQVSALNSNGGWGRLRLLCEISHRSRVRWCPKRWWPCHQKQNILVSVLWHTSCESTIFGTGQYNEIWLMFLQDPRGGATGSGAGPFAGHSARSLVQVSDHPGGVRLWEGGYWWRRWVLCSWAKLIDSC